MHPDRAVKPGAAVFDFGMRSQISMRIYDANWKSYFSVYLFPCMRAIGNDCLFGRQ